MLTVPPFRTTLLLGAMVLTPLASKAQVTLTAPIADSEIRVRLSASGKEVQWDVPETRIDFQTLTDGQVFLARGPVKITYAGFNPLRIKISATSKRSQSPDALVLSDLMTSILAVLTGVAPDSPGLADLVKSRPGVARAPVRPNACSNLDQDLATLYSRLYGTEFTDKSLGVHVKTWSDAIDDNFKNSMASGPAAVKAGSDAIGISLKLLRPNVTEAQSAWDRIKACANVTIDTPQAVTEPPNPGISPVAPAPAGPEPARVPEPSATASDTDKQKYKAYQEEYAAYVRRLQAQLQYQTDLEAYKQKADAYQKYQTYVDNKRDSDALTQSKRDASEVMLLQGIVQEKLEAMKSIISSAEALSASLDDYGKAANWFNGNSQDYFLLPQELKPTVDEMETVTLDISTVTYGLDVVKGSIVAKSASAAKASFDVRAYSRFAVEPGVGAVFGTVTEAEYGTAMNAEGQTVVAKLPSNSISIAPTIMVNFVCRCGPSVLTPMVQIGAATSKTVPALLLGGGIRIPGTSAFAIGGGAMFAWTKDLQTIKVGQVVSGTAEIEADREFAAEPNVGGYFTIQYKFGK